MGRTCCKQVRVPCVPQVVFHTLQALWCSCTHRESSRYNPHTDMTIRPLYMLFILPQNKFYLQSFMVEAWHRGRVNKLEEGMRRDPAVGGVLLITQWLVDAVGERKKRLNSKQGHDPLHGAKPAAIPELGRVPAVQLIIADNTTPPTLQWERGLVGHLWSNFEKLQ